MNKSLIAILVAVALVVLMMSIDVTSVYLILNATQKALHIRPSLLPWIATTYMLLFLGSIVTGGRLGDLFGHRRLLLMGVSLFAIASLLIGCATNLSLLLIGRALQGLGAGMMWPNVTTITFRALPEHKKHVGIGLFAGIVGLGLAIGPLIGGALTSYLSWRWLFLINLPIAIIANLILMVTVKKETERAQQRLDLVGALFITVALMGLGFGLSQLPAQAIWHHWAYYGLGLFAVFLSCFIHNQRKAENPILPKGLIQNSEFQQGCWQRFLLVMPFYITLFSFSLIFENRFHLTPAQVGVTFIPMTLTIALLSPVAGKFISQFGIKQAVRSAALCYFIAAILFFFFLDNASELMISGLLIFIGLGMALGSPASMSLSLQSAPRELQGAASGVFYMVSLTSGLIGVSVASLLVQVSHHNSLVFLFCMLLSIVSIGSIGLMKKMCGLA